MPRRKKPVRKLDAKGRREFVLDYCAGHVVHSNAVPKNLVGTVFLPLLFGAMSGTFAKIDHESIGLVYAVMGKDRELGGMCVNGYPMFAACRLLHKDDLAELNPIIEAELKRRRELKV